jgi:hypothetical protein
VEEALDARDGLKDHLPCGGLEFAFDGEVVDRHVGGLLWGWFHYAEDRQNEPLGIAGSPGYTGGRWSDLCCSPTGREDVMLEQLARQSPNVAVRAHERIEITLPEPPVGALWVRNGFAVWDWVRLEEGDWFWLDTVSPINPAWSQPIGVS